MPWSPKDVAGKTKAAKSPTAKRQWTHVANNVLKKTGSEKLAIIEANGVARRRSAGRRNK